MKKSIVALMCMTLALAIIPNAAMAQKNVKKAITENAGKTTPPAGTKLPMQDDGIVRLSKIEVLPEHIDEYVVFASEVGEISLQDEPGVLTMYAVVDKENPCLITILETYASKQAYESHIASDHFRKYKQATQHMIKSLELCDQTPLNPANRITNYIKKTSDE